MEDFKAKIKKALKKGSLMNSYVTFECLVFLAKSHVL